MTFRETLVLFRRGVDHLRLYGYKSTLRKVSGYFRRHRNSLPLQLGEAPNVKELIREHFSYSAPPRILEVPAEGRRLSLVTTDRIREGSLFGGTATALILAMLAATLGKATLRIVTINGDSSPHAITELARSIGISMPEKTEFASVYPGGGTVLPTHRNDRYLTTSWWTTEALTALSDANTFCLTQDDERIFYPLGDENVRCRRALLRSDVKFIYNTALLREHLLREGIARDDSLAFEPAFPEDLFYYSPERGDAQKTLLFYARPNHPRNLFYTGIEALEGALSRRSLPNWRVVLCGTDIPSIRFTSDTPIVKAGNLSWSEYASLVRSADVGLSLMLSPHPSYPPLDMAASGAVVVTTQYGSKVSLSDYSKNILCVEADAERLTEALLEAIDRSSNETSRLNNYRDSRIARNWPDTLGHVAEAIAGSW